VKASRSSSSDNQVDLATVGSECPGLPCVVRVLRVGVDLAEYLTRDAPWVRLTRGVSDALTLPFVRRAVDASLAGVLLVRVVASSGVAEARPLQSETLYADAQPSDSATKDRGVGGRHPVQIGPPRH
jgi:hypothetical protein